MNLRRNYYRFTIEIRTILHNLQTTDISKEQNWFLILFTCLLACLHANLIYRSINGKQQSKSLWEWENMVITWWMHSPHKTEVESTFSQFYATMWTEPYYQTVCLCLSLTIPLHPEMVQWLKLTSHTRYSKMCKHKGSSAN